MGLLSFQLDSGSQYLGKAMNAGVSVQPVAFRNPGAEMAQMDTPLSLSPSTTGSFGQATSWRSRHLGLKGLQRGNMRTTVDFNTGQVDPGIF